MALPTVVSLNETERALILISSSKTVFTAGPVSTVLHEYQRLTPDTPFILTAPDLPEYRLFTTKEGLFLSDNEICQHITDTRPGSNYSPYYIGVVWAGDLDRDGIVGLIIDDVSDSYNYYDWNLYLSSEAGPDSSLDQSPKVCRRRMVQRIRLQLKW